MSAPVRLLLANHGLQLVVWHELWQGRHYTSSAW